MASQEQRERAEAQRAYPFGSHLFGCAPVKNGAKS